MANELRVELKVKHSPSVANYQSAANLDLLKIITTAAPEFTTGIQTITAKTALETGAGIGTLGIVVIKNLHASSTINVGLTASSTEVMTINGGEFCFFRAAAAPFVTPSTGTINLQFWAWEA